MLQTEVIKVIATGNDATNTYTYDKLVLSEEDITVKVQEIATKDITILDLTTDYTITGAGTSNVVVTLVDASQDWLTGGNLSSDYKILIKNIPDQDQKTSFRNAGDFFAGTHEDAFDKRAIVEQGLQEQVSRSVKLDEFNEGIPPEIPEATTGQTLIWNAEGDFENAAYTDPADVTANTAAIGVNTAAILAKANSADLATVATTGEYSDVLNTPAIPTDLTDLGIADGTLGQVLKTNGAGSFAFATESGGGGGGGAVDSVNGAIGVVVLDKTDIGLANVDNTSDADKPVSTATQTALDLKANTAALASVAFTADYLELTNRPPLALGQGYREENLSNDITQLSTDVFVYHQAALTANLTLLNPAPLPEGFVFYFFSSSVTTLSVVDNSGAVNFQDRPITDSIYAYIVRNNNWEQLLGLESATTNISTFTGDGDGSTTVFDMGFSPVSEDAMLVFVDSNYQEQETYSISGSNITFSEAPGTGTDNVVVKSYAGVSIGTPSDGTVTTAKLADNSITPRKINGDDFIQFYNLATVNPIAVGATDVPGSTVSLVLDTDSKVSFTWGATIQANISMRIYYRLLIDSVATGGNIEIKQSTTGEERTPSMREYVTNLSAGTYSVKLDIDATDSGASVLIDPTFKIMILGRA